MAAQEVAQSVPEVFCGWQPIETAPKNGRLLLFYPTHTALGSDWGVSVGWWDVYNDPPKFISEGLNDEAPQPTHWQALPKPPEA